MEKEGLDALVVSGSEYTGFEGAVRYMCGFVILHRYAYVVIPSRRRPRVRIPPGSDLGGGPFGHLHRET